MVFYLSPPLSFFLALWFCSFYSNIHLHGQQLLLLLPWNVNYTIITLKYIDMRKIGAWLCRYEIKISYNCPGERKILSHLLSKLNLRSILLMPPSHMPRKGSYSNIMYPFYFFSFSSMGYLSHLCLLSKQLPLPYKGFILDFLPS